MVSRQVILDMGSNHYEFVLKDNPPFARPFTYLSSHCMLTSILFYELYTRIDLRSKDNIFSMKELIYGVLHHDDGKNTEEWQQWLIKNNRTNWTNYRDHADDRLFDPELHNEEERQLNAFGIPTNKNEELAKWIMRNHHPRKQLDGLSLRLERILIVLADHISANIEAIQSIESIVLNVGNFLSGKTDDTRKWLYGHLSAYYHPKLAQLLDPIDIVVEVIPKMEENIF